MERNAPSAPAPSRIGVVSDTHGLLRPEVLGAFEGVDLIIHAGDIGSEDIVRELRRIAPVFAVRGNMDHGRWAARYPRTAVVEAGASRLYVLHDGASIDLDPWTAGFAAVVSGHTHRASMRENRGVLHFNPGSAGPVRPGVPATVGILTVEGDRVRGEIVLVEP